MQCSPVRQGLGKSCLTLAELQTVASLYNKECQDGKEQRVSGTYKHGLIPLHAFKSRDTLLSEIQVRFKEKCGLAGHADHCWLEQDVIKSSSELYTALQKNYKPRKPSSWIKNDREWLNTFDILKVLSQYQEKHSHFSFLGVFPVDFVVKQKEGNSCIVQDMCNFNLASLVDQSKTSFGMIINLDRHDQPGSHWVGLYCCWDPASPKYGICYYDSAGEKPPKTVGTFIKTVIAQEKELAPNHKKQFQVKYNCDRHQFKGTECGIFSLLFVILCVEKSKLKFREVRKKIKDLADRNDNGIHKFRKVFYRD